MTALEGKGAAPTHLAIGATEKDTGLSKDVLRVWERRYGFPSPERDANGERLYPIEQVERLRAIRRLMDAGHRPGKLLALNDQQLDGLSIRQTRTKVVDDGGDHQTLILSLLKQHDLAELRYTLAQLLMKQGLQKFVAETVAPLNRAISEAWLRGDTREYHEHAYAEQVQAVLRAAMDAIPRRSAAQPTLLFATIPSESRRLDLLMLEAMLLPEGAKCVALGLQIPIAEIAAAALAYCADAVVLSFSSTHNLKQAVAGVESLRAQLTPSVEIWVGGELTRRLRRDLAEKVNLSTAAHIPAALRQWRASHTSN